VVSDERRQQDEIRLEIERAFKILADVLSRLIVDADKRRQRDDTSILELLKKQQVMIRSWFAAADARRDQPAAAVTPADLIDIREVCQRTGMGRTTIGKLIATGTFPRRVKIGTITRWSARAVDTWIQDRIAAVDAPATPAADRVILTLPEIAGIYRLSIATIRRGLQDGTRVDPSRLTRYVELTQERAPSSHSMPEIKQHECRDQDRQSAYYLLSPSDIGPTPIRIASIPRTERRVPSFVYAPHGDHDHPCRHENVTEQIHRDNNLKSDRWWERRRPGPRHDGALGFPRGVAACRRTFSARDRRGAASPRCPRPAVDIHREGSGANVRMPFA